MRRKDKWGNPYDGWGILKPGRKRPSLHTIRADRSECIANYEQATGVPWEDTKRVLGYRCVKVVIEVVEEWKPRR